MNVQCRQAIVYPLAAFGNPTRPLKEAKLAPTVDGVDADRSQRPHNLVCRVEAICMLLHNVTKMPDTPDCKNGDGITPVDVC